MTKSNPFFKNLNNINKAINSLLERNLNKLKFDNIKLFASNNKIILTVVALFVLFISYISIPTFYKQVDISKRFEYELLKKFNLDFTFPQKLNYNLFPRPHFVTTNSSIIVDKKNTAEIAEIKIFISLNNLISIKNVNINKVVIENSNFEINNKNYNFFIKILNNNFLKANLKIKNSKIFFRNVENEILFINNIKYLKYYYDKNELKNILYSENEIFNIPYTFEAMNNEDEKKLYSKLNLNSAKLQIKNTHRYENVIKTGSANLLFNKIKSSINYKAKKNFFEFDYFDEQNKEKFIYYGKLNFKPFYSTLEGNLEEINVSSLFGTNAIIAELLKTEIFNNKNIDFKLNINANKIKNYRNFINLYLQSKIKDGLVDLDETRIEWKDKLIVNLTDTLIFVKDGKLFLDGKSQVNISNNKNIYKFLFTPKNFRKKISTINFSFSYIFDEKIIILDDIIIDGKYNQKVNESLKTIYFRDSNMQNKIYLKNMMNDLLKAYAG